MYCVLFELGNIKFEHSPSPTHRRSSRDASDDTTVERIILNNNITAVVESKTHRDITTSLV